MRLALLTPDWTPNGGVSTYVRGVSRALVDAGHDVLVLHAEASNGDAPHGVTLGRMRGFSYQVSGPSADAAVGDAMEQLFAFRPDVVHIHGLNNIPLERRILSEFAAIKTFHVFDFCPSGTKFHLLTDQPCTHQTSLACVARQGYLRCTLSRRPQIWWSQYRRTATVNVHNQSYSRCIVASRYVKREALRTGYDDGRVEVVPYFTEMPETVTPPRTKHILFLGRLFREKGVDLLIDALAGLVGDWTCSIVGDGPEGARLRAHAATRGVSGRVQFVGWLNGDALSRAFDESAMVVVPSRWPEPFGIVGLEAMAHARPVVAFRVGGIEDWLEDGVAGWLVAPGDTRALRERLAWVLGHPDEAAVMGRHGRARVARDFVAASHLAKLLPIYKDLRVGL